MAAPSAHELDVLDDATARHEQRVAHLLESKAALEKRHAELIEFRHVVRETASFFTVSDSRECLTTGRDCRQRADEPRIEPGRRI